MNCYGRPCARRRNQAAQSAQHQTAPTATARRKASSWGAYGHPRSRLGPPREQHGTKQPSARHAEAAWTQHSPRSKVANQRRNPKPPNHGKRVGKASWVLDGSALSLTSLLWLLAGVPTVPQQAVSAALPLVCHDKTPKSLNLSRGPRDRLPNRGPQATMAQEGPKPSNYQACVQTPTSRLAHLTSKPTLPLLMCPHGLCWTLTSLSKSQVIVGVPSAGQQACRGTRLQMRSWNPPSVRNQS